MDPDIKQLKDAYIAASDKHAELHRAQTAADTATELAWDAMNNAKIALFTAQQPDIAAEVEAINRDSAALHERVAKLRQKVADHDLKLPQYYLKLP